MTSPSLTVGVLILRRCTWVPAIIVAAFCHLGWRPDGRRGVPVVANPGIAGGS